MSKLLTNIFLLAVIAIGIVVIWVLGRSREARHMRRAEQPPHPGSDWPQPVTGPPRLPAEPQSGRGLSLEDKLDYLDQCGIRLAAPFTAADLLSSFAADDFRRSSFVMLLDVLGGTEEHEPWRHHCQQFFAFDVECIEDDDSYTRVLEDMSYLLPELQLGGFVEEVDHEGDGNSSFSFSAGGRQYEVSFKQQDDWFSEDVLTELFRAYDDTAATDILFWVDTGGQVALFGRLSRANYEAFVALCPDVRISPVSANGKLD